VKNWKLRIFEQYLKQDIFSRSLEQNNL